MAYLLDANVFIQANRFHYGFDICPGFWEWVEVRAGQGSVLSVAQVGRELQAGNDRLADWAGERDTRFFLEPDAASLQSMVAVSQWVLQQGYEPAAVNTFLQVADYFLVATAHAHSHTVVTHERPQANAVRRVMIPNACVGMGVRFMNPFEMLRVERASFVLAQAERNR
ncbi:DUF4411 family protein [Solimonas soli]|uniref:DUF4411 family protein n=1 Tax=Solimonas soli TaxID=413479 RepID=UPI00047FAC7F|nr:DUF4411 family protein [Solimonas soli]